MEASHEKLVSNEGVVVDEVWDGDAARPEIRFQHEGKAVNFTSGVYSAWFRPAVGSTVVVVYDPESLDARQLSLASRWSATFSLVTAGSIFLFGAINELQKP